MQEALHSRFYFLRLLNTYHTWGVHDQLLWQWLSSFLSQLLYHQWQRPTVCHTLNETALKRSGTQRMLNLLLVSIHVRTHRHSAKKSVLSGNYCMMYYPEQLRLSPPKFNLLQCFNMQFEFCQTLHLFIGQVKDRNQ